MPSSRHVWSPVRSVVALTGTLVLTLASWARAETPAPSGATNASDAPTRESDVPESERVILLLRTPGDEDTISRLRFELQDGGWRILELRLDERFEAEPLSVAAKREGATAAVRVDGPRASVELWVRSPQGPIGESFSAAGEHAVGQVLALRVAEALRARGLLVPPAAENAPAEPVQPPPPPFVDREERTPAPKTRVSAPQPPRVSLELGSGVLLSPGGLPPVLVMDAGLRLELARIWSLSLCGIIPLMRQRVGGNEGEAVISTFVVGALAEVEWATFSFGGLRSGVGAGSSVTSMSGRARAGFESEEETIAVFTPLARTSFHVGLAPWLRLRAAAEGGATVPAVRVVFGSREVASWGRPFVVAALTLEASPLP
jgi:hypothetical protein